MINAYSVHRYIYHSMDSEGPEKNYMHKFLLTYCSLETLERVSANSADPDQTPQNAASDRGFHCLQIIQPFRSMNI